MPFLFNFIYFTCWTLLIPALVLLSLSFIPKWKPGLKERLGILNVLDFPLQVSELNRPLWFHAVSVGELIALVPLLKFFDGIPKVISVTTHAAYKLAKSKLHDDIEHNRLKIFYMPWDHPYIVDKVVKRIQPKALILMESEIWPALILRASSTKRGDNKFKTIIINAKLSDKSFDLYQFFYPFIAPVFQKLNLILAQSPQHSRKYISMGVDKSKVFMTGNIKFSANPSFTKEAALKLRQGLGYKESDIVWLCGSTHEEEESLLVSIFQEIKPDLPNLRLIIAPRHPERFDTVESIINSAAKLNPKRYSKFKAAPQALIQSADDILMIDTIGDLMSFYALSNIAFVGGTINDKVGGHNVLEPAFYNIPVVVGPHYHKNVEMVESLEQAGGLEVAATKEELRVIIRSLVEDADKRILMGAEGKILTEKYKRIIYDVAEKIKSEIY